MIVRFKTSPDEECYSSRFNMRGLGEVIIGSDWGEDSVFISSLDVKIKDEWKDMATAFRDKDIVPDNYNETFAPPIDEVAFNRGWNS